MRRDGRRFDHRYGTIICDLERRRIIDILPDREAETGTPWLADRPSITIIARDRGAGYSRPPRRAVLAPFRSPTGGT